MFYSQCLLSRQGPLKSIWVAAYYHKKLKKEQIAETDISSSVDEIMLHEVTVTYRVLGYLLLGVVRIYSKKVEYLYHDCTEVLTNINTYAISTKDKRRNEAMCASYTSITLPERFELDAFDLDIVEDISGPNPHQPITLEEAWKGAGTKIYCLEQYNQDEEGACFSTRPDGFNIPVSTCLQYNQEEEEASFETRSADYTPVKDICSPYFLDTDLVGSPSHNTISKEASIEKPLDYQLPNEACRQLDLYFGDEEPLEIDTLYSQKSVEELHLDSQCKNLSQQAERINLLEITPLNLEKSQTLSEGHLVANSMEETPDESNVPCVSGAVTPEFPVIHTPAKKEQLRFSRKRKHVFDNIMVLSNNVVRLSLHDSISLVVKRRRVPLTALDSWKASKISHLHQDFLEPLIPCTSQLKALFHGRSNKIANTIENAELPNNSGENGLDTQSIPPEQNTATEEYTPGHWLSMKCTESPMALDKLGTLTSVASDPQSMPSIGAQDMGLNLIDEEIRPIEDHNRSPDEWSVRTRSVARFLCKSFQAHKKQRESIPFNLAPVLEGRTRKESARLFYEILVLKTQGFVDVKQDEPYSDIVVLSTPQLEAIL